MGNTIIAEDKIIRIVMRRGIKYDQQNSLKEYLKLNEQVSLRRKFQWIQNLIKLIGKKHNKGQVYKELRPDNVFIDEFQQAWLVSSKVASQNGCSEQVVTYSAPEVLMGEQYNSKCDIFSFGLVANYIFTCVEHAGQGSEFHFVCKSAVFFELFQACVKMNPAERPTASAIENRLTSFDNSFWSKLPCSKGDYIKSATDEKNVVFMSIYEQSQDMLTFI